MLILLLYYVILIHINLLLSYMIIYYILLSLLISCQNLNHQIFVLLFYQLLNLLFLHYIFRNMNILLNKVNFHQIIKFLKKYLVMLCNTYRDLIFYFLIQSMFYQNQFNHMLTLYYCNLKKYYLQFIFQFIDINLHLQNFHQILNQI